jgi:hypothetical protein
MSSETNFGYSLKYSTKFIVRNITGTSNSYLHTINDNTSIPPPYRSSIFRLSPKKTIKIFNFPINAGETRDIMQIPGICMEDIRISLLKGEIRHKFLSGDIELVESDIDLLQFSDEQKSFLKNFGFTVGIEVGYNQLDGYVQSGLFRGGSSTSINYLWKQKIALIGLKNGVNKTFYTQDKFINGLYWTIVPFYNCIFNHVPISFRTEWGQWTF